MYIDTVQTKSTVVKLVLKLINNDCLRWDFLMGRVRCVGITKRRDTQASSTNNNAVDRKGVQGFYL